MSYVQFNILGKINEFRYNIQYITAELDTFFENLSYLLFVILLH